MINLIILSQKWKEKENVDSNDEEIKKKVLEMKLIKMKIRSNKIEAQLFIEWFVFSSSYRKSIYAKLSVFVYLRKSLCLCNRVCLFCNLGNDTE